MSQKFPGFQKCMELMRAKDAITQEDGFHALLPFVSQYVFDLIAEFDKPENHDLRGWIVELIGSAQSDQAFQFLATQLRSEEQVVRNWAIWGLKGLNTEEARTLLWQARSYVFNSPEETEEFLTELDTRIF